MNSMPPHTLTSRRWSEIVVLASTIVFAVGGQLQGAAQQPRLGNPVARLLWQNRETEAMHWGEVHAGPTMIVSAAPVKGFPKLEVDQQSLTPMELLDSMLLVGVRDSSDGGFQSGLVAIDTGMREEPHGNHSHWKFAAAPSVKQTLLDQNQGNPAHLSVYDGRFYVAGDRRNGFLQISPKDLAAGSPKSTAGFYAGGGGHITMAAVNNAVCYATWIDSDGPEAGRVDVADLRKTGADSIAYSFRLPSGVIHGATVNSGRVFFAPANGICWVTADTSLRQSADSVVIHHIPLGINAESGRPLRTGAFVNHRNWVLFATGAADDSAVCLLEATARNPTVVRVPIPVADGLSLTAPKAVLVSGGKRYAFVFQDRKDPQADLQELLTILELDPNGDRQFADARIVKTIPVGKSLVNGHRGHHSICFDSEGRHACFTNPGDGTIWVMTLSDLQIRGKTRVGGIPEAIVALGAAEHRH